MTRHCAIGGRGRALARGRDGFTLIELLVAMSVGLVVCAAAFALETVTYHATSRIDNQVDADQLGRTAMTKIVQLLHSSCVGPTVTPIQAGSTSSEIEFVSQFGSAVAPAPSLNEISLASNSITDAVYANTGGTAPNWTYASTPSNVTILANASQATINGAVQPVFQYYAYSNGELATTPLATPLTTTTAPTAAEVVISFAAGPSDGNAQSDVTINQTDAVVLRMSLAATATATTDVPCA